MSRFIKMLTLHVATFMVFGISNATSSATAQSTAEQTRNENTRPTQSTIDSPPNDNQDQAESADSNQIDRLIEQLGSPTYAIRQSATEQLWQLGQQATPKLERAVSESDPEASKRAAEILSILSLGLDATTSPEVAKLVLKFNFSEATVREGILEHLIRKEKVRLVYDLLGQIKNVKEQGAMFHEVMDFNDTVIRLARADRWDDIEFILSHPITLEHERAVGVHFHLVNGTLPLLLDRLSQSLQSRKTSGEPVSADSWLRLIAIYRMQRRFAEAEALASQIREPEIRRQILNQIALEKGDWDQIAQRMVPAEDNNRAGDGKIVVTPAQEALVNQLTGNQVGYKRVIDRLSSKVQQQEQTANLEAAKTTRATLVEIGLANLDWPMVEANIDRTDIQQTFNLYVDHQRIDQAFQVVGFEEGILQRNLWFNRKIKNIKSLTAKAKRLKEKSEDSDEIELEVRKQWQLCLEIADRIGSLGLTDEAVLHYLTLFSSIAGDESQSRRIGIIGRMILLEKYEEAWNLIERGIEAREIRQLPKYIFPEHQYSSAGFWNTILAQRYPVPAERLKVVSGMLNSPLGTLPDFDLDVELASAQSNPTQVQNGYFDLQFAYVLEYHGMPDASRHHMNLSKQLGNDVAKRILARRALARDDYATAAEYYESSWKYRTSALDSCLAAETNRKLGESKKAALRQCVAYAYWRGSYRNFATISLLESMNRSSLIADFLKLDVYCVNGNGIANERYRDELANAQLAVAPAVSAAEKQLILFNQCGNHEPYSHLLSSWGESRKQINLAMAKNRIAKGQFDEAVELLIRCNEFSPGDPSLGETTIRELDSAGATLQADRLFESLTGFYTDILARYPDSPLHHNNYAWLCVCADRNSNHMLRHAQKAVAERPNTSSYIDTLATAYFQLGETQKAIQLCRRCIELNPEKQHYRDQLRRFKSK